MENWKQIAIAPNYEVSDAGDIRRLTPGRRTRPGLLRKQWDVRGYRYVTLHLCDNSPKGFQVHRLVMNAFVGESPLQVNHINGDRADNRLANLEYVTGKQNQAHSRDVLQTMPKGERHHNAKINEGVVREIFGLRATGLSTYRIAARFGITATNVQYILKRKAWRHVQISPHMPST